MGSMLGGFEKQYQGSRQNEAVRGTIDLSKITVPIYRFASREDHIVPWKSAFRSKQLIGGDARFVLAASGHVAGVINPPARNKRSHWLNDDVGDDPESWFEQAEEKPGSWWPDWDVWMMHHSTGTIPAPTEQGNAKYRPIEPARLRVNLSGGCSRI
jgi:polyhydroxyalkanoate synthase